MARPARRKMQNCNYCVATILSAPDAASNMSTYTDENMHMETWHCRGPETADMCKG